MAVLVGAMVLVGGSVRADEGEGARPDIAKELRGEVFEDFAAFSFAGHGEQADILTHYLWYHFHHRLGNGVTLFNKEYLLTADIWMGNAQPRGSQERIQDVHRRHLLAVELDDEGYVLTHQHFSHAHDHGWPFPLWTQSDTHPDRVKGKTAGWHFQPAEQVRGWVKNYLKGWQREYWYGQAAADSWQLENVKSLGVRDNRWKLESTGRSPSIISPKGFAIDAFNAPYLQLRWKRSGEAANNSAPYIEWLREGDAEYGADRRVYFYPDRTPLSGEYFHSIMTMHRHPLWKDRIERVRICLAPGESDVNFEIDSFFTAYDTRHTINNPIFILASSRCFRWTGDLDFLRRQINRMRLALRYQQTVMGGLEHKHIRNLWPGHDGLPGFEKDEDGKLTMHSGHGIGNNYWDLMPFGYDDLYATNQYYAATVAMAEIEEAIAANPGWSMPGGPLAFDADRLREHAGQVKEKANELFWNDETGRFIASIDVEGTRRDYGYTFLNLDSIWYGLADEGHARDIMDWITGERVVESDTSTGTDIYHWRFGPRATTLRNLDWYGQGWHGPETIAWGGQIQDGGAVLGFTFYDLWARLEVLGPDNCWKRLMEILEWEKEVQAEGGYRKYYEGGKRGTTLQGGGTAGGLGIDYEFYESSLLPSIVVYGFVGLEARPKGVLRIAPRLPRECPRMSLRNVLYRNTLMDITVSNEEVELVLKDRPADAVCVEFAEAVKLKGGPEKRKRFSLREDKKYTFSRGK